MPTPAAAARRRRGSATRAPRTRRRLIADPAWRALCGRFRLDRAQECLLALLAATHAQPQLGRVLGYLEDDGHAHPPSPAAAARLFGLSPAGHPGPGSALVRWSLAAPLEPDAWQPGAEWALDPDIAAYLWGAVGLVAVLAGPRAQSRAGASRQPCLFPELLGELEADGARADAPVARGGRFELELVGRPGSGRRTVLLQLCAALGRDAVVIDRPELGVRALRTARLLDAVPVWSSTGGDPDPLPDGRPGALTLFACEAPAPERPLDGALRISFTIPELSRRAEARAVARAWPARRRPHPCSGGR